MSTPMRLSAIVHGLVQGVFYRDYTRRQALELGLTGYVRNLRDGTVEAIAEGSKEDLERFLEQLGEGSPSARVDKVDYQWEDHSGEFDRFEVRF